MPNEIEALFKCERCGAPVVRIRKHQRYCRDCKLEARREQQREYRARVRAQRGATPRPTVPGGRKKAKAEDGEAKPDRKPETADNLIGSVFDLSGKSIGRLAAEAHFLSLTYGEYVSMCQVGTIRRFLRQERGILDPDKLMRQMGGSRK